MIATYERNLEQYERDISKWNDEKVKREWDEKNGEGAYEKKQKNEKVKREWDEKNGEGAYEKVND